MYGIHYVVLTVTVHYFQGNLMSTVLTMVRGVVLAGVAGACRRRDRRRRRRCRYQCSTAAAVVSFGGLARYGTDGTGGDGEGPPDTAAACARPPRSQVSAT